jgi:hypothetical protein
MRLSWSAWLALPLLCSVSCEGGDSCGPTSDWPTCSTGESGGKPDDGANASDDEGSGPPKGDGSGTKRDAGKKPSTMLDGGSPVTPGEGLNAGDAGFDGGDGAVAPIPFDGGLAHCTIDSDGRDAGACFGVYCDVAQGVFSKLASDRGACLGADDLALACDGELARVVAQCAQDDVLMLSFGRGVALCAARAPTLANASESCIGCYVDEMLCALQNCLAPCLSGSSEDCTSCRRERCGADFSGCSGLPD